MDLFRTRKLFGMVQLPGIHHPYICRMSMTPPTWYLSPPGNLSGKHPELAVHPRMNSCSEQHASYYVRASIAFHLSCNTIDCYACFIFIVSPPPLFYCPVVPTTAADAPVIDYVDDDRTPTVELPGKQRHFPSPTYHLLVYIYLLH